MSRTGRRGTGQLEAEVMAILWDAGGWLTPREVLERMPPGPPVVYSTVMTILRRLWKKQSLNRRPQGKGYAYLPVLGREELAADRMVAMLDAAHDPDAALAHFLAGLGPARRRKLKRLLGGQ